MKKSHKDIAKGKEKDSGQIIRKGSGRENNCTTLPV